MTLVALCSTYLEGPLATGMIRSVHEHVDQVIVHEGPAGPPLPNEDACPPTDLGPYRHRCRYLEGAWSTDAKKRTRMIEATRGLDPPVWALWLDGDELLVNGQYLRDTVNLLGWEDDANQARDPDALPYMGMPVKLVELDGSVSVCSGKLVRADLIDTYSVSSSVFRNALGLLEARGNKPLLYTDWLAAPGRQKQIADGVMIHPPPLPCEPFLLHRSFFRHPARRGLRLHEQEATEIAKARAAEHGADGFRAGPAAAAPAPASS